MLIFMFMLNYIVYDIKFLIKIMFLGVCMLLIVIKVVFYCNLY